MIHFSTPSTPNARGFVFPCYYHQETDARPSNKPLTAHRARCRYHFNRNVLGWGIGSVMMHPNYPAAGFERLTHGKSPAGVAHGG